MPTSLENQDLEAMPEPKSTVEIIAEKNEQIDLLGKKYTEALKENSTLDKKNYEAELEISRQNKIIDQLKIEKLKLEATNHCLEECFHSVIEKLVENQ